MAHAPIQITLSDEAAIEFVRNKVRSGAYASEADMVHEGIETLRQLSEEREQVEREALLTSPDDQAEAERWIQEVGGPRYDRFHANPSTGISIDQLEKTWNREEPQDLAPEV